MRTDELTRMLARQAGTELQVRPVRAWAPGFGVGLSVSAATMVAWLGVLPDLLAYFASPGWLAKAGFAAAVAVIVEITAEAYGISSFTGLAVSRLYSDPVKAEQLYDKIRLIVLED